MTTKQILKALAISYQKKTPICIKWLDPATWGGWNTKEDDKAPPVEITTYGYASSTVQAYNSIESVVVSSSLSNLDAYNCHLSLPISVITSVKHV